MGYGIKCCHGCVAPKRHYNCHATCGEYKDEKDQLEEDKKKIKKSKNPILTEYDFRKIEYANKHKQKKRYKQY